LEAWNLELGPESSGWNLELEIWNLELNPLLLTMADFSSFEALDIRVGTILEALEFPEARKPAYKLRIDFGDLGILNSSAQITHLYQPESLIGKQIIAVVNFPPRQIGPFLSQVLVLGVYAGDQGEVVLLQPERAVSNGSKIG
jgi:tRNA-binding protein